MKCGVCGHACPKRAAVCPVCGSPLGDAGRDFFAESQDGQDRPGDWNASGDVYAAANPGGPASMEESPGGAFPEGFDAPAPAARREDRRRLPRLIVGIAAALAAVLLILLPRRSSGPAARVTGLSAPSGAWEEIGRDSYLVTNELLVTGTESLDQAGLEELLAELDGAVVGYFPLIHQYQVRFNTNSRAELDTVRARLEESEKIRGTDYNLVLSLRGGEIEGQALPWGGGTSIGLMDALLPAHVDAEKRFFLPSHSFGEEEELLQWAADAGAGWPLSGHGAAMASSWGGDAKVLFAACFYCEQNSDGSLTTAATSAALRYQLCCLAQSGARVISVPFVCLSQLNDPWVEAEARQWEQVLSALDGAGLDVLICKADEAVPGRSGDALAQALRASSLGREHLLSAGACAQAAGEIRDLAGGGMRVYAAANVSPAVEACFPVVGSGTASAAAAQWAASLYMAQGRAARAGAVKAQLLSGFDALAADEDGRVIPALAEGLTDAAKVDCGDLAVWRVTAADSVTGLPVAGAAIRCGGTQLTAADGTARVLTRKGQHAVSAAAGGYASASERPVTAAGGEEVTIELIRIDAATGTVRGTVSDAAGGALQGVRMRIRDGDTAYPDREVTAAYSAALYPGEYEVTLWAHDRTAVTVHHVTVEAGQETQLPAILLGVPSDLPGKAEGIIKDALTGDGLDDARLTFYAGADAEDAGAAAATAQSTAGGAYSVTLPGGTYTAYVAKDGYRTGKMLVRAVGEETIGNQNLSITPRLAEGQVRIVLEWGENPSDLDSHLVNRQQGIHTFYSQKQAMVNGRQAAELDVDDTTSYGPETTTIQQQLGGVYTFYVQDYTNHARSSGSRALASSGATVTVYVGDREAEVFRVPDEAGTLWTVFTLENGAITPVGTVTYFTGVNTVGE